MAKFDLKRFRKQVSELKKAGLIKNVDARTAQPFFIRQGKTLKEQVKKFSGLADDINSGKVQLVKLPPKKIKDLGYEKINVGKESFAEIPKLATEKVKVENGTIVFKEKKGMDRIKTAVPFDRLEKWLRAMKRNKKRIDRMKANNEWFAFKIFNRRSWNVYRSIDDLIDALLGYESWQSTIHGKIKTQQELYEGLEILRIADESKWHRDKEAEKSRAKTRKEKTKRKNWIKRIKQHGDKKKGTSKKGTSKKRTKK